jgi:hypothetical protein
MTATELYLEATKRTLMAIYGPRQVSRRRVIEMAVVTLKGGEFSAQQLRLALDKVCPRPIHGSDPSEESNVAASLVLYARKGELRDRAA